MTKMINYIPKARKARKVRCVPCLKCGEPLTRANTPSANLKHGIDVCNICHAKDRIEVNKKLRDVKKQQYKERMAQVQKKYHERKKNEAVKKEDEDLTLDIYDDSENLNEDEIYRAVTSSDKPEIGRRRNELLYQKEIRNIENSFDL